MKVFGRLSSKTHPGSSFKRLAATVNVEIDTSQYFACSGLHTASHHFSGVMSCWQDAIRIVHETQSRLHEYFVCSPIPFSDHRCSFLPLWQVKFLCGQIPVASGQLTSSICLSVHSHASRPDLWHLFSKLRRLRDNSCLGLWTLKASFLVVFVVTLRISYPFLLKTCVFSNSAKAHFVSLQVFE